MHNPTRKKERIMRERWYRENWYGMGAGVSFRITKKLFSKQTPFQKIEIFETQSFGRLAVFNDCVMLTDLCNHFYHEMLAHPALMMRWAATRVGIIGGGDCGVLREALRHRHVVRVDQVEIDPMVTEACKAYFPYLAESNGDPRAHFHHGDGIAWVQQAEAESYDIIIVDSTDPEGPAAGLFDPAFYRRCFAALSDNSAFVTQSGSPIFHREHISAVRRNLAEAGFRHVTTITFPQPDYPSGTWSATLAFKGVGGPLKPVASSFVPRGTKYYSRDVHNAAAMHPSFAF